MRQQQFRVGVNLEQENKAPVAYQVREERKGANRMRFIKYKYCLVNCIKNHMYNCYTDDFVGEHLAHLRVCCINRRHNILYPTNRR